MPEDLKGKIDPEKAWEYLSADMTHAMVYFKGLQALCPRCHQILHFGKAKVDGKEHMAIARLMVLNNWSYEHTSDVIDDCF